MSVLKKQKEISEQPENRVYTVLITQVYSRSSIGTIATIVNASILVLILRGQILDRILIAWLILIMVASLMRLFLNRKFLKVTDKKKTVQPWGRLLIISLGIVGILWGSTGIFLFPANSIAHQAFIAFLLAGMVAGAVGVFSPIMPAFLAFSIPALAPITIRFIIIGDEIHLAMGAMTTLFAILTFTTAKRINRSTEELVTLKETFAGQLEKRTAELENSNEQLREEIKVRMKAEQELHRLNEILEQRVTDRTMLAEERARKLQALAVELIEAEERERRRIADLLHEDLQQLLASAKFVLQSVSESPPRGPELGEVERMLSDCLDKSRTLTHELSPGVLYHSDLPAVLEWLSQQMHQQFGINVALDVELDRPVENTPLKVFIFRSAKELVFNIVKHAGVKTANVSLSASGDTLTMIVSDLGAGFDPFILEKSTPKSGLGLLSLQERASYIGGSLTIESAPGKGSRIKLTVPLTITTVIDSLHQAVEYKEEAHPQTVDENTPVSLIRVLFADDHKVMRQGLIRLLSGKPDIVVVGEADNGRDALELARQLIPDVIVMDVSMPEMDGIEATRRIKAEIPQVRVIGLSMYQDDHIAKTMRDAGAETFVSKAASSTELLKAIYGINVQGKQ
jgi:signal transduction histidine kinase/ActR/RegA family two-component response regulator